MLGCIKPFRNGDCFCSRYDENRQTMFYCGFFTTIAGFLWFIIGFTIRCAFFVEAFGPSVDAVACGIMIVGIMIMVIGIFSTISIVCTSKTNKTSCVSSGIFDDRRKLRNQEKQNSCKNFRSPFETPTEDFRTLSFSSNELSSSIATSSSVMSSSRPSTSSQHSHGCRSDIAIIA